MAASSDNIELELAVETTENVAPVGAVWETLRVVSEDLSATPTTTPSAESRGDGQATAPIVDGLEAGGTINYEFSPVTFDTLIAASHRQANWTGTGAADITSTDGGASFVTAQSELSDGAATWVTDGFVVGMLVTLDGTLNTGVQAFIAEVTETTMRFVRTDLVRAMVDETASYTITYTAPTGYSEFVAPIDGAPGSFTPSLDRPSLSIQKLYRDIGGSLMTTGGAPNTFSLNVPQQGPVTGSMAIISRGATMAPAIATQRNGGTVTPATSTSVMRAGGVAYVTFGGVVLPEICTTAITYTVTNNIRAIRCHGSDTAREIVWGRMEVSGEISMLATQAVLSLYNDGLQSVDVGVGFGLHNAATGETYKVRVDKARITGPAPPKTGANADVIFQASWSGFAPDNGGPMSVITREANA